MVKQIGDRVINTSVGCTNDYHYVRKKCTLKMIFLQSSISTRFVNIFFDFTFKFFPSVCIGVLFVNRRRIQIVYYQTQIFTPDLHHKLNLKQVSKLEILYTWKDSKKKKKKESIYFYFFLNVYEIGFSVFLYHGGLFVSYFIPLSITFLWLNFSSSSTFQVIRFRFYCLKSCSRSVPARFTTRFWVFFLEHYYTLVSIKLSIL